MLQETDVFELPVTRAENCRDADGARFPDVGDIATVTVGRIVTSAVADLVESATAVAVREKKTGFGGTEGAVYRPEESTVPQVVPAHPVPVIVHVTALLDVPVTVALNCLVALTPT
jgi:hypothetical protein